MRDRKSKSLSGIILGGTVLVVAMFGLPNGLQGQQSSLGSLTGNVTDVSGAVVPGAKVVATNVGTNESQQSSTTSVGSYTISGLPPGDYTLTVEKQGFETETVTGVVVFAGQEATANVALQVGSTLTRVTIVDQAPLISPNSAEQAHTIENDLVQALPYNEADVLTAIMAVPGVMGGAQSQGGVVSESPSSSTSYVIPGSDVSVAGARLGNQSYLVDGSDNQLTAYAREGMVFSGQDVSEISVVTNGIPAQYGRTGGGIITVATKGGTNTLHGTLMWRHSDPSQQALNLDSATVPQLHENFFGIYVGGPVYIPKVYNGRNKTFFFVDVEPYRKSNLSGSYSRVETPDELAGNFYNSYSIINTSVLTASGYAAALAAPRVGGYYYQFPINSAGFPIGSRYASASQYVPIPAGGTENLPYYLGAQLAANPLATYIASNLPTPQTQSADPFVTFVYPNGLWLNNGDNVFSSTGVRDINNRYGFRIDQQFSTNDHLFGRFSREPLVGEREGLYSNSTPFPSTPWDHVSTSNVALNEVHMFGPHMVNELHGSFLLTGEWRAPNAAQLSKNWGPTLGLFPAINGVGFPSVGVQSIGYGSGFDDKDQSVGVADDLTWTIGRHSLRMGVDFRRYQMDYYNQAGLFGGSYGWGSTSNGTTGGDTQSSFYLGELSSYSDTPVPVPEYYRFHYYGGYVQDDIKVRHNLTLNAGLRYEFETPRMEKYNRQGTFLPGITGTLNGMPATGAFCFSGACGLSNYLWPANYRGFEPRLGLAYSPKPYWTVRASYGLLRAPLTGMAGYGNYPEFNIAGSPVGGQYGGTNPNAWVNTITNPPVQPTGGFPHLSGGPYFNMYPVTVPYVPQNSAVPFIHTWEFDTQWQVTRNDVVEASYVGNHGGHEGGQFGNGQYSRYLNVPNLATVVALGESNFNFTTIANNPYGVATATGTVVTEGPTAPLLPYPNFFNDSIAQVYDRDYDSEYDALFLSWTHRTSYGLWFLGSFQWVKLIDDSTEPMGSATLFGGGYAEYQNPFDLHGERALSTDELPVAFKLAAAYQLPVGKGKMLTLGNSRVLNNVLGNWVSSGMFRTWEGQPVPFWASVPGYFQSISPTNGSYGTYLPAGYNVRPNLVPGVPKINPGWRQDPLYKPYFNPAMFSMPGAVDAPAFGNMPRTICCAPHVTMFDASLQKRFALGAEHRYFQLEADAMNVLNHPQMEYNPNSGHTVFNSFNFASLTNPSTPAFTVQNSAGFVNLANTSSRLLQLGMRLVW